MSQEHCKWEKFMSVLIFKTTSLLSDLNGGKPLQIIYPPPQKKKKKKTKKKQKHKTKQNKTNKQKTKQKTPHICAISIVNFN